MAQSLWGLSWADYLVIVVYFALTLYLGLRGAKRVRSQEDYFLGGRRFGKWIQTFAMFGQATSADTAVSATTMVANGGAAGMAANLIGGLLYMPVLWMTAPWYRRLRLLTMADFFTERYQSKGMGVVYALCMAIFLMLASGLGYVAMGKTIAAILQKPETALTQGETQERARAVELKTLETQDLRLLTPTEQTRLETLRHEKPHADFSYANPKVVMLAIALCVLLYTSVGGLAAAFITDLIQGSLIIVLTLLLIPFAMLRINALHGVSGFFGAFQVMHQQLPAWYFELLGSPKLLEFNWMWILAFGVVGMLNTAVQANQLTAIGSARDDATARYGATNGVFIKRYCSVIWGLVAMLALVLYGATISDPDLIWGRATRDLLGPANLGLVGLMIACLFAALMSTASALTLTTAALLTGSVYRPLVPNRDDTHYVKVGRLLSTVYIFGGLAVAFYFNSVFDLLKFLVLFNSIVAAAFWLGMTWRRANTRAAWASITVTGLITLLLPLLIPLIPGVRTQAYLQKVTAPLPVTRSYQASGTDVLERQDAIAKWDRLAAAGLADTARPTPLTAGQTFPRTFALPQKSVFWMQGVKEVHGVSTGQGLLKVELVALDLLGWDLSKNTYALNETLCMLVRILVPFGVLLLVGLCSAPQEKGHLDRFYAKLKTPTYPDRALDALEIERTMADPARYDHLRLFPRSAWEFNRWDRQDWTGVLACTGGALGVVALLVLITRLGG
ncbi:MAG TPA: sodium:solute symporter family protein [Armatimonadota bacterium]|jgi:SSS family solute:Na+ symporter